MCPSEWKDQYNTKKAPKRLQINYYFMKKNLSNQ